MRQKSYERQGNILVYDISYKTSTGPKPWSISFNKIDGFIRVFGSEFRYLVSFVLFDKICDKIKHLISEKSNITDSINHNSGKIKIIVRKGVPASPFLRHPPLDPGCPPILFFKSLCPLLSVLFHPCLRYFRQFPQPCANPSCPNLTNQPFLV